MSDIKSRVTLFDPKIPDVFYFASGSKANSIRVRVVAIDFKDEDGEWVPGFEAHVWHEREGWVCIFENYVAPTAGKVAEDAAAVLLSTTPAHNEAP